MAEPTGRSEWTAIPVPLDGPVLWRKPPEKARRRLNENTSRSASVTVGRFNELSGGIFYCLGCDGRRQQAQEDGVYEVLLLPMRDEA